MKSQNKEVIANYIKVKDNIGKYHREITLVAVSKFQKIEKIMPLLAIGHRCFGESRVDEAYNKWGEIKSNYDDLELHFIGGIQSRKIKDIVAFFDVIQSVDRLLVAEKISIEAKKINKIQRILIQINIGNEPQKRGVPFDQFSDLYKHILNFKNIKVEGIMCIPPQKKDVKLFFEKMRKIAQDINIQHISMGMSNDYITAIDYNATIVRVGSLIFGERTVS